MSDFETNPIGTAERVEALAEERDTESRIARAAELLRKRGHEWACPGLPS